MIWPHKQHENNKTFALMVTWPWKCTSHSFQGRKWFCPHFACMAEDKVSVYWLCEYVDSRTKCAPLIREQLRHILLSLYFWYLLQSCCISVYDHLSHVVYLGQIKSNPSSNVSLSTHTLHDLLSTCCPPGVLQLSNSCPHPNSHSSLSVQLSPILPSADCNSFSSLLFELKH